MLAILIYLNHGKDHYVRALREKRERAGGHQYKTKREGFVTEGVLEIDLAPFAFSKLNDVILYFPLTQHNSCLLLCSALATIAARFHQ